MRPRRVALSPSQRHALASHLRISSILLLLLLPRSAALRFGIGERVECNLGDRWERGTIISLNHLEDGRTMPYQAQLDIGNSVFAPQDDDDVIRQLARPKSDVRLRFAVGNRVECNLGDRWELGFISAINYYTSGQVKPYQAQLDSGGVVTAPRDNDGVIRRPNKPRTDERLRFVVGDRVEANLGDHWERGEIVSLNFYNDGSVEPYEVKLDSGKEVFAPRDDDSVIRRAPVGVAVAMPQQTMATRARSSKMPQKRVGRQASPIGTRHTQSKLSTSKLGKVSRARSHQSARPKSREEMLARWRSVSDSVDSVQQHE